MSESATRPSNEVSGKNNRQPAEVKYVSKSLVEEYFKKSKIKAEAVMFETSKDRIYDSESTSGGNNSESATATGSKAGSHTKIEQSVEYKLAYLFKFGFLQIATKDKTPKAKNAKVSKPKEDKQQDGTDQVL